MVNLFHSFNQLKKQKILVVGDLVLDAYTIGKVGRISPEAPVVVVRAMKEENLPGMAGNVALNLVSLGSDVVAIGRVGEDDAGRSICNTLSDVGVDTSGIIKQKHYSTPIKNRVIADHQQVVRIDYEEISELPVPLEDQILAELPRLLQGIKLVAVSDYAKGFVTQRLMSALIALASEKNIPVVVDPKGVDFSKYAGADFIKPNEMELYAAANLPINAPLEQAAKKVLLASQAKCLMVTRSSEGISLFYPPDQRENFPVTVREVNDVTGAGDTVLATFVCALASGLTYAEAAQLSNCAAGIAVQHTGCYCVTLSDLARNLLGNDAGSKVFQEEHLFALKEGLKHRRFVMLSLSVKEGLTAKRMTKIHRLAQKEDGDFLLHVRDGDGGESEKTFIESLAALHDVDFIITSKNVFEQLCEAIPPAVVFEFGESEEPVKICTKFDQVCSKAS